MATLGDLLAAARRSSSGFRRWLEAADPDRATQIESAAVAAGLSTTGFVRAAIADFSRFADEEDWATLLSALRDDADPGTVCLLAMVDWRLSAPGCDDHRLPQHEEGRDHDRPVQRPAV
jgi:hypothetical protein